MRLIYFHYNSIIVPFVFFSLILGYKYFGDHIKNKVIKKSVFVVFIFANIISIYLFNPIPTFFVKEPLSLRKQNNYKLKVISDWDIKLKDTSIKVATTPILAPYFTKRTFFYNFLYDGAYGEMGYTDEEVIVASQDVYKLADYVIIDRSEIGVVKGTIPVKFYQRLKSDGNYKMIYTDNQNDDSIEVYKKI